MEKARAFLITGSVGLIITCLTLLVLLLLAGCNAARHQGRIETFDPNGVLINYSKVTFDKEMMMEVTDGDRIVKADSRKVGEGWLAGILKIITLGLIVK